MVEEELTLALSRLVDSWSERHVTGEPDWVPLERTLPPAWIGGFMWMGRACQGGRAIELYKHGITRRYLNLDTGGQAYEWDGGRYRPIRLEIALDLVYEGLLETGWTRETRYDDEFIARRNRALIDGGWTVISGRLSESAEDQGGDSHED